MSSRSVRLLSKPNLLHNSLLPNLQIMQNKDKEIKEIQYSRQLDNQLRDLSPTLSLRQTMELNRHNSTKSLIISRHPFQRFISNVIFRFYFFIFRLISAYRDKIERCHALKENSSEPNPEGDWYYRQYGREITRKFRRKYISQFGEESLSKE